MLFQSEGFCLSHLNPPSRILLTAHCLFQQGASKARKVPLKKGTWEVRSGLETKDDTESSFPVEPLATPRITF